MTDLWQLPQRAVLGGKEFDLRADYKTVLKIFSVLGDPELPERLRWLTALALFYVQPVPRVLRQQAMEYLREFICCGEEESAPGPKLLDWQQDAGAILAGVNKAAGQEIRALPFVHWWTFLSWFHAMGEGQLSTLVSIRDKLQRGKKLADWEREFYRQNKKKVDLKPRYSQKELEEQARLKALINGQ